jgi:hypothetical protein
MEMFFNLLSVAVKFLNSISKEGIKIVDNLVDAKNKSRRYFSNWP